MNPDNSEVDLPHVVHPFRIFPVIFHLEFPFSSKKIEEKKGKKKGAEKSFLSPHAIHSTLSCLVLLPSDHSIFYSFFFFYFQFLFSFFYSFLFLFFTDPTISSPSPISPCPFFFPPPPFLILYFLPPLPFITCCSPDRHLQIFFFLSSFSPLVHIPPPYSLPFSIT